MALRAIFNIANIHVSSQLHCSLSATRFLQSFVICSNHTSVCTLTAKVKMQLHTHPFDSDVIAYYGTVHDMENVLLSPQHLIGMV